MAKRIWIVAVFFGTAALLEAGSPGGSREVSVTVYNNDLGLVREVRKMEVPSGTGEISFTDVPSRIDPTSVHIKSPAAQDQFSVLEQNYEYDLVNSDKILSKYIDQNIQIFTKEGKMFEGKLLSAAGDIVLEKKDGGIGTLNRSLVQNIDFPKLPEGLISRPTLQWKISSKKGGAQDLEVSYLTGGISWHAEYVAVADKDDKNLELSAWVSIDNQSGASYENAKLKLIAGDVHRAEEPPAPMMFKGRVMAAMNAAMDESFQEKSFFEYHLYTLSRPATVKDNQTKQISLFPPVKTAVKKIYAYDASKDPKKVNVVLEFENSEKEGLGMPLPAGKIRVYKQDDGASEFVGEDKIEHTPRDEKIRISLGSAFDVTAERKQKDIRNLSDRARQESFEVVLKNHKATDVEVVVTEHFGGEWDISQASHKFEKKDARTAEFKIPVKKDGSATVTYTVTTRW